MNVNRQQGEDAHGTLEEEERPDRWNRGGGAPREPEATPGHHQRRSAAGAQPSAARWDHHGQAGWQAHQQRPVDLVPHHRGEQPVPDGEH